MTYDDDMQADATLLAGSEFSPDLAEQVTHVISVTSPAQAPQRTTIGDDRLVIGRCHPAGLVLEVSKVSRQHCCVEVVGGVAILTDLGSTNGSYVNGKRITVPTRLNHGATITIGGETLTYERLTERDVAIAEAAERDLQSASAYVQMLLPKPLVTDELQANWLFMPCAQLGGSGFGYRFLSPTLFCGFMIEVAGRGTQTAMHAVAVMNLMRQPAVSGMDFTRPDQVLAGLARAFPSDQNGGLFFTACYFTFDLTSRTLSYAAAGRAPAYLADLATGSASLLTASGGPIGLRVDETAHVTTQQVPPGARLVVVSDEVCDQLRIGKADHMHALAIASGKLNIPQPLQMHQAVRDLLGESVFEHDFVALVFTF